MCVGCTGSADALMISGSTTGDGRSNGAPDDLHWAWYLSALLGYITLAVLSLSLRDNVLILNWIFGPLFPLIALHLVPKYAKVVLQVTRP